jgi:predicted transposase/invertase (TIGR01784 family)
MIPGVDPKVDFAFKKIFGSETNIPLLIDLLHAVLNPPPDERIVALEILNPFNIKDAVYDKQSILDIKVRDANGKLYNVEMQMTGSIAFPQRMLYYWALMYGRQLHEGEDFTELRTTISICFVNSVLFPEVPDYHLDFQLRSARHPELIFCSQQSMHVLELPKFQRTAEELVGPLDVWCYFLLHGAILDSEKLPEALKVAPVEKAMEVLAMLTKNDSEWFEYQARLMAERDQKTRFREARQGGLKDGEVIGRIHICQRLLKQPTTPSDELAALPSRELHALAEALEKQLGVAEK